MFKFLSMPRNTVGILAWQLAIGNNLCVLPNASLFSYLYVLKGMGSSRQEILFFGFLHKKRLGNTGIE
jgi:hypothetical protein